MITEKERIQRHWSEKPCGGRTSELEAGTISYFKEIDDYRYGYYAPWLPEVMGFHDAVGKQLLEVGVGQGTDLAMFARNGAICTGLDLTRHHLEIARQRFEVTWLSARFVQGDGERLPFEDEQFDIVYSYGVLHHTPDIGAALREVHRVLRPGGEARIMIYAKFSEFNLFIHLMGALRLEFLRHGYDATISHWCEGTAWDNPVRVGRYSANEADQLMKQAGFDTITISKHLLTRGNIPVLERFLSDEQVEQLARYIGWNLIIRAQKK